MIGSSEQQERDKDVENRLRAVLKRKVLEESSCMRLKEACAYVRLKNQIAAVIDNCAHTF